MSASQQAHRGGNNRLSKTLRQRATPRGHRTARDKFNLIAPIPIAIPAAFCQPGLAADRSMIPRFAVYGQGQEC
jgi:hypothetical protein